MKFVRRVIEPIKDPIQIVWENGKCGYYNTSSKTPLTPCIYEEAESFFFDTAMVKRDGKYGYIDNKGNEIVPCQFDWLDSHLPGEPLISYGVKGASMQYGFINTSGKIILPAVYDKIDWWSHGLAAIQQGDKWGFVNQQGQIAIPLIYDHVNAFSEELALVKKDGKYGYIHRNGKTIIPFIYEEAFSFKARTAKVKQNGKWGAINPRGAQVLPCIYDQVENIHIDGFSLYSEEDDNICPGTSHTMDLLAVSLDGKHGLFDNTGKATVPVIYDKFEYYNNLRIAVGLNGKYGVIDTENNILVPIDYDDIRVKFFYIAAKSGNKYIIMDNDGAPTEPITYDEIVPSCNNLLVRNNGKWGCLNFEEQITVPCIYDKMEIVIEGILKVEKDGESFEILENGERIIKKTPHFSTFIQSEE